MPDPAQLFNSEASGTDLAQQHVYQHLNEPVGDFGIWNGQFEQGPDGLYPAIEGWQKFLYTNGSIERVAGGQAGNWCVRGGQAGTGRGGYMLSQRYIPVDPTRDYYVSALFKGSSASSAVSLALRCYSAAKVNLGDVYVLTAGTPGTSWTRYERRVGPNGDVGFFNMNVRYVQVLVILQANVQLTGDYAYVDDVQFQQLKAAHSGTLHADVARVSDTTLRTFTAQAYTVYTGSAITLTTTELGWLWFSFQWSCHHSAIRTAAIAVSPFINGTQQSPLLIQGWSSIGQWEALSTGMILSDAAVAAGVQTIDLRIYVYNVGDTLTARYLTGQAWWHRAN